MSQVAARPESADLPPGTARHFAPELGRLLESEWTLAPVVEELFAATAIRDDLLRMMFSCCHPQLAEEGQMALILNILCGFSVDEIAAAFVSSHAAIEKRILRAKKVLAGSKRLFDIAAPADCSARLPAVQRALYLLFNEGYHGASPDSAVRAELCHEAMRLAATLLGHPLGATPSTHAVAALMCLDAARLPARIDGKGNLRSLFEQDRSLWDRQLVTEGLKLLELAATGSELTAYHVEAAIASVHASAARAQDTDWAAIVSLYDTLLSLRSSPIVALNRAIALAQRDGAARGLEAINAIALRRILSTTRRSASSSFACGGLTLPENTSVPHLRSRAIRWSGRSSIGVSARANRMSCRWRASRNFPTRTLARPICTTRAEFKKVSAAPRLARLEAERSASLVDLIWPTKRRH
jgi:RNA polymerase sigma-70 factor (ECF subfamily)